MYKDEKITTYYGGSATLQFGKRFAVAVMLCVSICIYIIHIMYCIKYI